jgi:hypothetical protein
LDELLKLFKDGYALVENFEKVALEGLDPVNYAYFTFLHLGNSQFDTLDSVISLLEKEKYKDCFALLRSVFESYFFLRLMMHGKRFREIQCINIVPQKGKDATIARDETLEKWRASWKSGDPKYAKVVELSKEDEDVILVTIEDEGLYQQDDPERKGSVVTRYFFAFDEYDPETKFVAKLPSVYAGDPYPDITEEQWREQKMIYNQYFYVPHLVRNLRMNGFLDDEQSDRFEVHYSFLSTFVHPTKLGTVRISNTTYRHPYTPEIMRLVRYKLVLLYVCKLESMLLQSLIRYFLGINPKADFHEFEAKVKLLENATRDFWFIYDSPTTFDVEQSESIKKVLLLSDIQCLTIQSFTIETL